MASMTDFDLACEQDRHDAAHAAQQDAAVEVPEIVADVDSVLRLHRQVGHFECHPCDPASPWLLGPSHEEHQALELYSRGLLAERPATLTHPAAHSGPRKDQP